MQNGITYSTGAWAALLAVCDNSVCNRLKHSELITPPYRAGNNI